MKTLLSFLLSAFLVLLAVGLVELNVAHPAKYRTTTNTDINGNQYVVCVLDTKNEREIGIHNPACADGAMFYFEEEQRYIFNMVDVEYPLLLVPLTDDWQIQEVILMQPNEQEVIPSARFRYALELKNVKARLAVNDVVMYID